VAERKQGGVMERVPAVGWGVMFGQPRIYFVTAE